MLVQPRRVLDEEEQLMEEEQEQEQEEEWEEEEGECPWHYSTLMMEHFVKIFCLSLLG